MLHYVLDKASRNEILIKLIICFEQVINLPILLTVQQVKVNRVLRLFKYHVHIRVLAKMLF